MYVKHYDSVGAFLGAKPSDKNTATWDEYVALSADRGREWFMAATPDDGERDMVRGWPEGSARARAAIKAIATPAAASVRRRVVFADQGDDIDMARVYSGALDTAWRSTRRESHANGLRPCVRLMVNVGADASRSSDEFFWRGAAAVVLADALENAGRSVEIVAYSMATHVVKRSDRETFITVRLKGDGDILDIDRVAALTAHASAHRIGMFRARCALPYVVSDSFGCSQNRADPPATDDAPTFVIRDIWDEKSARTFVTEVNRKLE